MNSLCTSVMIRPLYFSGIRQHVVKQLVYSQPKQFCNMLCSCSNDGRLSFSRGMFIISPHEYTSCAPTFYFAHSVPLGKPNSANSRFSFISSILLFTGHPALTQTIAVRNMTAPKVFFPEIKNIGLL